MDETTKIKHDSHYNYAELSVRVRDRTYTVEVRGPEKYLGQVRPARVNWAAYGSVPPDDAAVYGALLQDAAEYAERWDSHPVDVH